MISPPDNAPRKSRSRSWRFLAPYRVRLALGALLLLATNAAFIGIPVLLGKIMDAFAEPNVAERVPRLAGLIIVCALVTAVTRIGSRVYIFTAARAAEYDLRSTLFRHLLAFEPRFYQRNAAGDVMSRVTNDVQTVRAMWGVGILNVVNTAVAFATVLFMMFRVDPLLTAWAVLPYPTLIVLGRTFGRRIYRASREVQEQLGKLSASIQQDLTGIAVIKTYTLEERRHEAFREGSERLLARNMKLTHLRGMMVPALTAIASLGTAVVLWFGGKRVIDGAITVGALVEFLSYLARLVWPTLSLGWMLSLMQRGYASWARIDDFLSTPPSIQDGVGPPLDIGAVRGKLEFRGLTLELDGAKVLDDIHLLIEPGEVVALVGRTGAGKSSLVNALTRLVDVTPGTVFLDDRDITDLPLANLRGAISYAPQEAFLFSATIGENISYGIQDDRGPLTDPPTPAKAALRTAAAQGGDRTAGDRTATRASIVARAATTAGLSRDLSVFPEGLETIVGERGLTLSGGQRQRVALARALAANAPILVLDDSLSSVDAETERVILTGLTELLHNRTSLLISHRVAAIQRADRIVVLDAGRLIEQGTHRQLIARQGLYAEIYQSQLDSALAEGASLSAPRAMA